MELLTDLEEAVKVFIGLQETVSSFETISGEPKSIIKFILDTELDYYIQGNSVNMSNDNREKSKSATEAIKERIKQFHVKILQIHCPDESQQGYAKKRIFEEINKANIIINKIFVNV
jgi:hypothetical protein